MNCPEVQELFSDYLDGRLAPPQAGVLREHLGGCAACRQELAELSSTIESIGFVEEIETSPDFLAEVNRKIDGGAGLGRPWRRMITPARIKLPLEAAALATVALFAVYLYRSSELPRPGLAPARKSSERLEGERPRAELDTSGPAQDRGTVLAYKELARKEAALPGPEASRQAAASPAAPARTPAQSPPTELTDLAGAPEKSHSYAVSQAQEARPAAPPPQVVEVKSSDLGLFQRRVRDVLASLTGRIVSEQASEEGLLLSVELPESREEEFRSALKKEAGAAPPRTAAAKRLSQAEQRARSSVSAGGIVSEAKTAVVKEEPTVAIQIQVWAKK